MTRAIVLAIVRTGTPEIKGQPRMQEMRGKTTTVNTWSITKGLGFFAFGFKAVTLDEKISVMLYFQIHFTLKCT